MQDLGKCMTIGYLDLHVECLVCVQGFVASLGVEWARHFTFNKRSALGLASPFFVHLLFSDSRVAMLGND